MNVGLILEVAMVVGGLAVAYSVFAVLVVGVLALSGPVGYYSVNEGEGFLSQWWKAIRWFFRCEALRASKEREQNPIDEVLAALAASISQGAELERCWICKRGATRVVTVDGHGDHFLCPFCVLAMVFGQQYPDVESRDLELTEEEQTLLRMEYGIL